MINRHYDSDGNLILERDGVTLTIPSEEVGDVILWAMRCQPDKESPHRFDEIEVSDQIK